MGLGGSLALPGPTDGHCVGPFFAALTNLSSPWFIEWVDFGGDSGVPCGTHDLIWTSFQGRAPLADFLCPCGTFAAAWLDRVVEREGFIKCITVRHLVCGLVIANEFCPGNNPLGAASSASMSLLRSFGLWRFAIYKDFAPLGLRKASRARRLRRPGSTGSLSLRGLSNISL